MSVTSCGSSWLSFQLAARYRRAVTDKMMQTTWEETRLYIERSFEDFKEWHRQHNEKLEGFTCQLADMRTEIALLKQKAALIGFLAGLAASSLIGVPTAIIVAWALHR